MIQRAAACARGLGCSAAVAYRFRPCTGHACQRTASREGHCTDTGARRSCGTRGFDTVSEVAGRARAETSAGSLKRRAHGQLCMHE
eukprot:7530628-Pyramimonas_sp.AAC.1